MKRRIVRFLGLAAAVAVLGGCVAYAEPYPPAVYAPGPRVVVAPPPVVVAPYPWGWGGGWGHHGGWYHQGGRGGHR